MGCGVFIINAPWSVHAQQALARVSDALSHVDQARRLEFVIAGIDESPGLYEISEFLPASGAGETAWVSRGNIIRASRVGQNVEPYTRELLATWPPYTMPPSWPTAVVHLAEAVYSGADASFALHDALLEAGHPDLAQHFQEETWHPKGCWVVDMITGRTQAQ